MTFGNRNLEESVGESNTNVPKSFTVETAFEYVSGKLGSGKTTSSNRWGEGEYELKKSRRGKHTYSGPDGSIIRLGDSDLNTLIRNELIKTSEFVDEGEGISYLTPKAFDKNKKSTGANDIYYYKLGYKPVPKKIKGAGTIVKQLWEKEELTEYSDFQQKRISTFDDVEGKINSLSPLLSNAKNETAKYYNENPGSYAIVYSTDMINELLDDITELLKQEE